METTKPNFYEIFKLGIEIEYETNKDNHNRICAITGGDNHPILHVKGDGSIERKNASAEHAEIVAAKPWQSQDDEDKFIEVLKSAFKEFKSSGGEDIFAYKNDTCGTHFHFSFKDLDDQALFIFDRKKFQQFFLKRYLETFNSPKFLERIRNNYGGVANLEYSDNHKIMLDKLKKITLKNYAESKEHQDRGDRYNWLNTVSIRENTGMELRIFPHIQTYKGLDILTKWVKDTLLDYWLLKETQEAMKYVLIYNKTCRNRVVRTELLNETKQLILEAISLNNRNKSEWNGDIRLLLGQWVTKQPKLIKTKEEIL